MRQATRYTALKLVWSKVTVSKHSLLPKPCIHNGSAAIQVGRRITEAVVLTGSVVRIWGALERVLSRHEHSLSRSDRTMRVLRVDLDAGRSLVGANHSPVAMPEKVEI
jgi:hypothetical protein